MTYKIIQLYARCSPEDLIAAGEAAGLTETAVEMFRHAEEYPIKVLVVAETGEVVRQGIATIPGGPILLLIADFKAGQISGPYTP